METASFCGQCGTGIPAGNKFCTSCGTPSGVHQAVTPEMLASLGASPAPDTAASASPGAVPAVSPAPALNGAIPACAPSGPTLEHEAATTEVPPSHVAPADVPAAGSPPGRRPASPGSRG